MSRLPDYFFFKSSPYFSRVMALWKFGHFKLVSNISQKLFIALLWKSGGYTGFALSFQNSVVLSFCHSVIIQMELEYLCGRLANVDQILSEASLRWGKGCIRFQDKLDQNSDFHGNRKCPLTCNGENDVSTFSRLFLIWFFLYLQVMRTCISLNFGQIGPLTME